MNTISFISCNKTCTEQWTQINLKKDSWFTVEDVIIENDNSSSNSYSFVFAPPKTTSDDSNFGGAVWNSYNLVGKRGIRISFKPSIIVDTAYYGNVKYPQGFAIVLTSSSTKNLIGNKGSGLGYEGINNGIVFEFDFIRQSDKEDYKRPHLSLHYNLNGEISSKTDKDCTDLCNKILPNFYDNTIDEYKKNMIFEFEIIGKKLSVKTNTGKTLIEQSGFEAFSQLLEQEEVYIGITASMNLNKKITIEDFSLSEISIMEKGELELIKTDYTAGDTISLFFSIKSTCGEYLKIYPNEYSTYNLDNSTDLSLIINNNVEEPSKIVFNFNDTTTKLKLDISRTKSGTYTALVKFRDNYSSPVKFKIEPGNIQRLEICNQKEALVDGIYLNNNNLEKDNEKFIISVCPYDQYNNSKEVVASIGAKNFIKVLYPNYYTADTSLFCEILDEKLNYKIPFSTFGQYEIFNDSFIQNSRRFYNMTVNRISPEKSDATILYGKHLVDYDTPNVILRLKLRDEYGRDIPNRIIQEMKCNFSTSYIENSKKNITNLEVKYENNDIIYLSYSFKEYNSGKYTFIPKIRCEGDEYDLTLKCSETEDDENSIYDKCAFYVNPGKIPEKFTKIRLYSDFLNDYIYFEKKSENIPDSDNNPDLLVSLDEFDNKKLTEINLLDDADYPLVDPNDFEDITCSLDNKPLSVLKVGYSIACLLNQNDSKENYNVSQKYILTLIVGDKGKFDVGLKFVSLDNILNNMNNLTTTVGILALYQQECYTIEATENILLFEVYKIDNHTNYLIKETFDNKTLRMEIKNDEYPEEEFSSSLVEKDYSVLIYTNSLQKIGTYKLSLYHNNIPIFTNLEIKVVPSADVKKLIDDENQNIGDIFPMNGDYKFLSLIDKYGNQIKDNNAILAFSKLELKSNGLKAKINMNGKIFIYPENNSINDKSIEIILPSGISYEIQKVYKENKQSFNPHKSYGLLNMNTSIIVDTQILVNLYMLDDNGNNFTDNSFTGSEIDIYAIEKFGNKKKYITLKVAEKNDNILTFNASITSVGEYEIKIFYKNIYVPCKACHFIVSSNKIIDYQNTRLYIIGNKRKIPVFGENSESRQFLLTSKNFIINLQFYDKYFNEIPVSTQYSLSLYKQDTTKLVKLCNYGNSKPEGKQFYHVCSDQKNIFEKELEGEYRIDVNGKIFSFFLSHDEFNKTSSPTKAIFHQYENVTYATTDSLVSLIVDLRDDYNMRVNVSKFLENINIKLESENNFSEDDFSIDKVLGPDNGLFTLILNIRKIGEYKLNITYKKGEEETEIRIRNLKIIISCGMINNLEEYEKIQYFKGTGTYAFFNVLDINNETCKKGTNNSWNIINNENYLQNLFNIGGIDNNIYYSSTKYFNHLTGVLSVVISNQINNNIELNSTYFDFKYPINQSYLSKEKLDKEYIYVNLDSKNTNVKLTMLKKNYEPYSDKDFELGNDDKLTLSILRYENDETKLVNEYEFNKAEKKFQFSENDIKSQGDYFFIVYLNGEIVPCGECHIKVDFNETNFNELFSIDKTKIYIKNGYNKYEESKKGLKNIIYKTSFPFFKINFQDIYNNLMKLTNIREKFDIKLELEKNEEENQICDLSIIENEYNGNVYLYLNSTDREKYLKFVENEENRKIKLIINIKVNDEKIDIDYILFNKYSSSKKNYEKCNLGAQPVIVNLLPSYTLRANENKEIEVYLDGCSDLINQFDENNNFIVEIPGYNSSKIHSKEIPADTYGNYILLINYENEIYDPTKAYIKYLNGKSDVFKISVLPGYDINSISLEKDEELGEASTNYKYAYILMELKDSNDNIITNLGRNLFFNDINILKIYDLNNYTLPYKLSFDERKKNFRVEIPINGNGVININSTINGAKLKLTINETQIYHYINFNMTKKDKDYTFNMTFLDDHYKIINSPQYFSKEDLSFIYISENYASQEFYSIKISSEKFEYNEESNEIKITLNNVPIYNSYMFIPVLSGFEQICFNCLKKNDFSNYLYSIHNNLYYPHNLKEDLFLQKKYEYPLFVYFSNRNMGIPSSDIVQNIKIENNYFYIYGLRNSIVKQEFNITIGNETKNIKFNENNIEIFSKETEIQVEKYYYNYISFISGNNGRLLDLYFYVDIRDNNSNPIYISNELTTSLLSGKSEDKILIDYLNVFQTEINGTYLVIIPANKLINGKYTINFIDKNHVKNDSSIVFNSIGSFPNIILLNNKEMIYKNMIKYDLIGQNENSELICDERLNIYIEPKSTSKFINGEIVDKENKNELTTNSCKLYIKFIGDINIITNIGDGFLSELTNSDNSIYNINPHYSKFSVDQNIITILNNTKELNVSFNERSSDDLSFLKDEMPVNKGLQSIRFITSTKYELIQTINGLFASEYLFSPSQFKITSINTFLFIGSISNNYLEEPVFISFIKNEDGEVDHLNVELYEDNLWKPINDILSKTEGTTNILSLKYPYKMSIKLIDQYGSLVRPINDELQVSIISKDGNKINYNINLEVKLINGYEYIIESYIKDIDDLIHMETKNSESKFLIRFIYGNLKYFALLDSKNENNLHPRVSQKAYSNPMKVLDYQKTYRLVNEYENEKIFYFTRNSSNSEVYCFVDNNDLIFNGYIDPNLISCSPSNNCKNIEIINSYRGCIKIGGKKSTGEEALEITYNNTFISTITLFFIPYNKLTFNLSINSEIEVNQDEQFTYKFKIQELDIKNSKFFSVYLNGQKLKKSQYTFSSSNQEISIIPNQILTTLVPKNDIKAIYSRGILEIENEIDLVTINILQNEYHYSENGFRYSAQVPSTFKAGDKPYFYLIIKDTNYACYYGKRNNYNELSTITAEMRINSAITIQFKIDPEVGNKELDDVPGCEYIYILNSSTIIEKSGLFNIDISDDSNKITNDNFEVQMYIAPGEFDFSKLDGDSEIFAGESFDLYFTTIDSYNNQPNYYDIVEHFEIKLFNSDTNQFAKEGSIKYQQIKVSKDNDRIEITMTVIESGNFLVIPVYNNSNLTSYSIRIKHRECSFNEPKLNITEIDKRNDTFYSGEEVEINIYCSDIYGNLIKNPGSENFKALIKNNENIITYENKFDEIHKIYFTTENEGEYNIQIYLNGKGYSDSVNIFVEKFNETLFMCMNKKQVTNLSECTNDKNYFDLISDIEGDNSTCHDSNTFNDGKVFYCKINDTEECIDNTNKCNCEQNFKKKNGYCYPNDNNPYNLVENKVNCLSILQSMGKDAAKCGDGSCRLDEKFCNTKFECPLGFKSCGNKCILLSETCELTHDCQKDQVLCWDFSCANSYSLCPTRKTCTDGKVICPDGTCQNSGHCPQPISRKCKDKKLYQCPDFTCVQNKTDCHKNEVCPIGQSLCEDDICRDNCEKIEDRKYKCSNGLYVDNSQLCPSEMQCPNTWIKCPQGGCAKSQEKCKFIQGYKNLVCPKNKPILCPDFECVPTFNLCKQNFPVCPPHKPYQCWNNECRKSFSECPTEISCPPNSPLLCTNGLCVNSINNCHEKSEDIYAQCKNDKNKVRCFDGSCAISLELCPTHSYCGKDKIKCWNGACVDSITNCKSSDLLPQCTSNLPYRCPDGSCRKTSNSCSTISVCPNSLPVKCFDNSCRATIDECPEYHSCGLNKVNCPDGTCAKNYDECNTIVTCDSNRPYLCYDSSCRSQLEDCPVPPSCGNKNVQCPNGSCATSRQYCKFFSSCEAKTPIRCEMNICTDDLNNCPNNNQCPIGYVKCRNGDCKIMSSLCEENICPPNVPYRCPEGVCAPNKDFCDDQDTGCPYNARIKCRDGTCVKDISLCIDYSKIDEIDVDDFCEDGSNRNRQDECPNKNGCPKDKDLKCADGTCVNSTLTECPPVYCPRNKPIKCLSGLCVAKSSDCLSIINNENTLQDNLVMCLDGRKVTSYDFCRPIFECPSGYKKCLDNTCRLSKEYCPEYIQCPKERPYRTSDDENEFCSKYNDTSSYIYCPKYTIKCDGTGECLPEEQYNETICKIPLNQTGCPKDKPIRCDNGRCMHSESECILANKACPEDDKPFLCNNGKCVDDLNNCNNDEKCEDGFIRCYNGRCVENNEDSYLEKCTNEIGCPLNKPYRCSNGECVSSQRKCEIISEKNGQKILNTICDSSKPYLCSDYSCESDYSFCKLTIQCPEGYSKCINGYCVKDLDECIKYENYCPQNNPIKCPSGSCTTNILKCPESFPKESCQEGQFYCVRLGKCVTKKSECLINYKNNNQILSKNNEVLCYDGTFAEKEEKCPVVPSCKVGQYRCENGGCAYNKSLCIVDDEYKCNEGEKKCPDGLCHKNCEEVTYQGCLVGEYLCSNGMCVKSEVSCVGFSMCEDPSVPYRCINGECKSDISLCPEIEKLSNVRNISYSFNKDNRIEFEFAFDPKGRSIGKLIVPSKGILLNKYYTKINIEEVPISLLLNDTLYNNTPEFLYNISNGIEGSEGVLNVENAIMSPIFKFYSEDLTEIKFNIPALLIIEHNTYTSSAFYYYDYCLATLSHYDMKNDKINYNGKSQWECIQRQEREEQKEFKLNNFGVYAIILNPLRDEINYLEGDSKNIIFENFKVMLLIIFIIFILGLIVVYVFSRVMRYRGKYKENLAKIELLKQQKEEYKQMQTDVFGQSLGDNLIGIVYAKNPGFNEEDEEMKEVGGIENEIEDIQRKIRNMELQNDKLKENLDKLETEYKQVNSEIEQIKNNN